MTSTVPPGRDLSASLPRHFVLGYYQPVPPGQKSFANHRIELAFVGRSLNLPTTLQHSNTPILQSTPILQYSNTPSAHTVRASFAAAIA